MQSERMAALPPRVGRTALPADGSLTPGAHNLAISLAGEHIARVIQDRLDLGEEDAKVADQLTTAVVRAMTSCKCRWECHTISPPEKDGLVYSLRAVSAWAVATVVYGRLRRYRLRMGEHTATSLS